jgi:subtilisin-like proprotein convertase family protein
VLGSAAAEGGELEIVRPPLARELSVGDALDLGVAVAPLRSGQLYEWRRDGQLIAQTVVPRLEIDRISLADADDYDVMVMDPSGSVVSSAVRVDVIPPLPGREAIFRYRGGPAEIPAGAISDERLAVPDHFELSHVRVTVDLRHEETTALEIYIVSPGGTRVRLFNVNTRQGAGLRQTSFDDEAGSVALIGDAQPPFTGVFLPGRPLSQLVGVDPAGSWQLRLENASVHAGELLGWTLELRAQSELVNFANYRNALGIVDGPEARLRYSLANPSATGGHNGLRLLGVEGGGFVGEHWRWSAAEDVVYSYEGNARGGWFPVVPTRVDITCFPGGRQLWRLRFSTAAQASAIFRLRANIGN